MLEVNPCLCVCTCSVLPCAKCQTVCLLASKVCAISFWGLNQNHCLSQYPAVLVRQLSHGFSLLLQFVADDVWLFKNSLFFWFWGNVWAPFREPLRWSNPNSMYRGIFLKAFSLAFHLFHFLTIPLFPSVREWIGQGRRECGCDVFRAVINKSVLAHALWNPEPLYPFHVFHMSLGPDLWPLHSVISGPGETVSVYVCVWVCVRGWSWSGFDYLMTPVPLPASPYPLSSFHRL